jgi:hypothetical protein
MREASKWLSAYVGVYAQTLIGRKQWILFTFRRDGTTCQVHMPHVVAYVVPDVMVSRALGQSFLNARPLRFAVTPSRRFIPLTDAASALPQARENSTRGSRHKPTNMLWLQTGIDRRGRGNLWLFRHRPREPGARLQPQRVPVEGLEGRLGEGHMRRTLVITTATFLSFGIPGSPDSAQAQDHSNNSANAGLNVDPPKDHKTLDPNRTYLVKVTCSPRGALPVGTIEGLVRQNIAATHLLAISDANTNAFPAADKAKAFIAVYAVSGDTTNRTSYINEACSTSFFLTARKPLFLLTNASKVTTNELGTGLKFVEAGLSLLSSVWPLFTGLPIPSNPGNRFKAVKDASGPIDQFITIFNRGASPMRPYNLYEGTYTIKTDYSLVKVNVQPLISIVGLKNKNFTVQYQDAIAQVFKDKLSSSMSSDQSEGACLAISNQMRDQQAISSLDIAYGLAFLARDAGLRAEQIIRCLGKRYASQAVQFVTKDWDERQAFDANTVSIVWPPGNLTLAQPEYRTVKPVLINAMGAMRAYAIKDAPSEADKTAISVFLAPTLNFADQSNQLSGPATATADSPDGPGNAVPSPFKTIENWKLLNQLRATYRRFGCLYHDNDSLAMFLAIPESPKPGKMTYQITDVLVLRLWLNAKQQISQLQIDFDGGDIGAAVKANGNACGQTVIFAGS